MQLRLKWFDRQNVGDAITYDLARHFFTRNITVVPVTPCPYDNLLLVGSGIHKADEHTHICGSGLIMAHGEGQFALKAKPKAVHAVRGPLTRKYLHEAGIEAPEIYGDPAVLMGDLYPLDDAPKRHYGLVAHYADAAHPAVAAMAAQGVHLIDVRLPPAKFIRELQACEVLMSSSLHGIILSHVYGRKCSWVRLGDGLIGGDFKFRDYHLSLGMTPQDIPCTRLTPQSRPEEIAKNASCPSLAGLQASIRQGIAACRAALFG